MGLKFTHRGNFNNMERYLRQSKEENIKRILHIYGRKGLTALESATPMDTGETRLSWHYKIVKTRSGYSLNWYNTHMAGSVPVIILLQYGHATGSGAYVQGRDIINPTLRPIFDSLTIELWKEVQKV